MDLVTEKPSLDVEVECFVNSLIVDVLEDLELENRKQWNNAKLNICDKSESHTDSVVSSVSSTVPSLKVLACDAVKNADAKACERHGILRFMGSNSENSSSSLCSSLSPTFSDLSQPNTDIHCKCHLPQKLDQCHKKPTRCTRTNLLHSDTHVESDDIIRQRLAEAYEEGYQAAVQAGVSPGSMVSQKDQLIAVQEQMLSQLCEERDQIESVLHMREQEWYSISRRLVSEIEDLRVAYNKLINECAHENIRLSNHAYRTMFRALYTNDKALSTSVELQTKINEQKLQIFAQEKYISGLERRVVDLEERLSSILQDGGCGDEATGERNVLMYDRTRYTMASDPDTHHVLVKNFEIGGTCSTTPDCNENKSEESLK